MSLLIVVNTTTTNCRDGNREPVSVENQLQIVRSIRIVRLRGNQFLLSMPACFSGSCVLKKRFRSWRQTHDSSCQTHMQLGHEIKLARHDVKLAWGQTRSPWGQTHGSRRQTLRHDVKLCIYAAGNLQQQGGEGELVQSVASFHEERRQQCCL